MGINLKPLSSGFFRFYSKVIYMREYEDGKSRRKLEPLYKAYPELEDWTIQVINECHIHFTLLQPIPMEVGVLNWKISNSSEYKDVGIWCQESTGVIWTFYPSVIDPKNLKNNITDYTTSYCNYHLDAEPFIHFPWDQVIERLDECKARVFFHI